MTNTVALSPAVTAAVTALIAADKAYGKACKKIARTMPEGAARRAAIVETAKSHFAARRVLLAAIPEGTNIAGLV